MISLSSLLSNHQDCALWSIKGTNIINVRWISKIKLYKFSLSLSLSIHFSTVSCSIFFPMSSSKYILSWLAFSFLDVCFPLLNAVWTGSTSFAKTQGLIQILRLYSQITHVHLPMVLWQHLLLLIFQWPLILPLELMVYDMMHIKHSVSCVFN